MGMMTRSNGCPVTVISDGRVWLFGRYISRSSRFWMTTSSVFGSRILTAYAGTISGFVPYTQPCSTASADANSVQERQLAYRLYRLVPVQFRCEPPLFQFWMMQQTVWNCEEVDEVPVSICLKPGRTTAHLWRHVEAQ